MSKSSDLRLVCYAVRAPPVSSPLEAIRFAAANRLCVDLHYLGGVRRIEPYSLRRNHRRRRNPAVRNSDR